MVEGNGGGGRAGPERRSSLRLRVLFLVCLVAVPLSVERMFALLAERQEQVSALEDDLRNVARNAQLAQLEGISRALTTLQVISRLADQLMEDPAACNPFLARLTDEVAGIHGAFISDASGLIRCAHAPLAIGVNIAERDYFRDAVAAEGVVMTDLFLSRVSGRNSVFLLRGERGAGGAVRAVAGVVLDLQTLSRIAAGSAVELGGVVDVIGENGALLVRYPTAPDLVERSFPDHPLTRAVAAADSGIARVPGFDGRERIFAFDRLGELPVSVAVGMETAKAMGPIDSKVRSTALAYFAVLACFLLLAWVAEERIVIAPIARLTRAVAAVGRGETDHVNDMGIAEFSPLVKAFNDMARRLSQRNNELRTMNGRLASLARTDGLTGLANRRTFDVQFSQDWVRTRGDGVPLTLVMLDVDHFKAFNDTRGHLQGDEALRSVARMLSAAAAGTTHLVARYGGEEFVVLMSGAAMAAGVAFAEDVRRLLAELAIEHPASPRRRVTASFGVASVVPTTEGSPDALIAAADAALYEAKRAGRDRVIGNG